MHRCTRVIKRFLELVTGELVDKLEVAYAKAAPEERTEARDAFVEEKAKHHLVAAATIMVMTVVAFFIEKTLPET